ncbi:MAG: RagB/SusD family nutrient uptake outer membrane protein [Prolixibacteraceae bacterium]
MKRIKYIIVLFLGLITLGACNNFLDPEPDGRRNEELVFTEYTYALGFFANIYGDLPNGFHSIDGAMEACMTDDAEHSNQLSAIQSYNNGTWNKQSFTDSWLYAKYYASLRKLAIFLDNVDNAVFIDPNTLNRSPELNLVYQERFKAEAYFLRAFFYFELVKRFGGVAIVPEARLEINDELNLPRNSFDECVEYIVSNCDLAAQSLPVKDDVPTWIGHATKASSLALKSRMLLYAASPLNNPSNDSEKWIRAAKAAIEVIDLPAYGLVTGNVIKSTGMFEVWNNFYNQEVLFAMPYFNNNDLEFRNFPVGFQKGQGLTNPTQNLVDAFETSSGETIAQSLQYDAQNPYENRDPRLSYSVGYNGSIYNSRPVETFVGGLDGLNKDQNATKTGYYLKKYMNVDANLAKNTQLARHQWIHFRYAEMLLNYAEAMNEAYGPANTGDGLSMTSLSAVNKIRNRVGMPDLSSSLNKDQLRERIQNERRVELCFEGHRAWDVRRWKKGDLFNTPVKGMRITSNGASFNYEVFNVEQRVFDTSKMYLMPIPQSEILKSDALVQNPNW